MKKKYILIIVLIILIIISIIIVNKSTFNSRLIRYIESKGFIKDAGDMYASKTNEDNCKIDTDDNCSTTNYYFNIVDYKYLKRIIEKQDNVLFELSLSYDYKNNNMDFNYRITYENGNLIYKGSYNDEFECNNEYNHGINITDEKVFCDYVYKEVDTFKTEADFFIQNTKYLKKMSD